MKEVILPLVQLKGAWQIKRKLGLVEHPVGVAMLRLVKKNLKKVAFHHV